jgi:integrase
MKRGGTVAAVRPVAHDGRSVMDSTNRSGREVTVAPGVTERHALACKASPRRRCTCTPSYLARLSWGPRDARKRYSQTFDSAAEARGWVEAMRATLASGGNPVVAAVRHAPALGNVAEDFLADAREGKASPRGGRTRYSENTIANYETMLRLYVRPHIDSATGVPLERLPVDQFSDPRVAQEMVDVTARHSPETARLAASALSAVLRYSYQRRLVGALPPRLALPAPNAGRDRTVTPSQFVALMEAARKDDECHGRSLMVPLLVVLGDGGLRISEALALVWGSDGVDLEAEPARIVVRRNTTKSEAGARVVHLDQEAADVLRAHFLASGRPGVGSPVFARTDGSPHRRHGAPRSALERIRAKVGVEVTPHVLRHSHGTWAGAAGITPAIIAARLGHGDASFTARRYVHAQAAEVLEAPRALAEYRKTRAG